MATYYKMSELVKYIYHNIDEDLGKAIVHMISTIHDIEHVPKYFPNKFTPLFYIELVSDRYMPLPGNTIRVFEEYDDPEIDNVMSELRQLTEEHMEALYESKDLM